MASSMIHIAVASELNKKLNRDKSELLIGTIAPDISKLIGESKRITHFVNDETESDSVPDLDLFLKKYKNKINDDFVLGYYIHLFTDYLWFKYFLTEIWTDDMITKLDGTVVKCEGRMALQYIYNDYTNLNINLIDDYNLDLKIFYNEIPEIENIITEIPMNKLFLIVDKAGEIIENTKVHKDMVFNMKNVHKFIETTIDLITDNLKELNVL